jgi:peptidoglycan/LPS O-acetylase OafA/YrhL
MTADTWAERHPASRPHLGGIESLRAYAALAIVVFHVIHLQGFDPPESLMFLKWHLGRGVPLFFAVSAFGLAYGYEGRLGAGSAQRDFYIRRLFRIAPLYYAAMAFQIAVNFPPPWTGDQLRLVVLSVLFLFNLSPPDVEGVVLASWSIGVEMLFYLALPVVFLVVRDIRSALAFVFACFVGATLYMGVLSGFPSIPAAFIQHGIIFNLPYFAFGLLAYFLWKEASAVRWRTCLALAVVSMVVLVLVPNVWPSQIANPYGNGAYQSLWGLPFGALCLALAWRDWPPLSWSATYFLGRISFSLYLAHPHVIDWLSRLGIYDRIRGLPGGVGVTFTLANLVTIGVLIPLAWALYRIVEAPGMSYGKQIVARLRRAAPDGSPA